MCIAILAGLDKKKKNYFIEVTIHLPDCTFAQNYDYFGTRYNGFNGLLSL